MIEDPRLKTKLWLQAAIRTCQAISIASFVIRSGDEDAGDVLIKQNLLGAGFRVLTQIRKMDGERAWRSGTGNAAVTESEADAYIARQIDRDYDLWVLEIEDREGRLPFGEIVA